MMIGSAQHELGKWLSEVSDAVFQKYAKHFIKDSFKFVEFMQNLNIKEYSIVFDSITLEVENIFYSFLLT